MSNYGPFESISLIPRTKVGPMKKRTLCSGIDMAAQSMHIELPNRDLPLGTIMNIKGLKIRPQLYNLYTRKASHMNIYNPAIRVVRNTNSNPTSRKRL